MSGTLTPTAPTHVTPALSAGATPLTEANDDVPDIDIKMNKAGAGTDDISALFIPTATNTPEPAAPAPNPLQVEITGLQLQLAELIELYERQVEAERWTISWFEREMGELKAELLTLRAVVKNTLAKEIRTLGEGIIAVGELVRRSPSPASSSPASAESTPAESALTEAATPNLNPAPAATTDWEFGSFVPRPLFLLKPDSMLK